MDAVDLGNKWWRVFGEATSEDRIYEQRLKSKKISYVASPHYIVQVNGAWGKTATMYRGMKNYDECLAMLNALET